MQNSFLRRVIALMLGLTLLLTVTFAFATEAEQASEITLTAKVKEDSSDLTKYGNIVIDIPADDVLAVFSYGDIVTIALEGYGAYDAPIFAAYDDVAAGEKLLRTVSGKDYVSYAINYGQAALEAGLIEPAPEGSETAYVLKPDVTFPIAVTITLKQHSDGTGSLIGKLVRANDRAAYPELSDEQFANLRVIATNGIGEGKLYRSSSPINPEIGRSAYADAAAAEAGIKTFINLADNESEAVAYDGYAESYYAAQKHIYLGLPAAFTADAFKNGLAEGFRFMLANEAPYMIHCNEGKDRAGIAIAVLECLTGASYDEVVADYTESFKNYYSVEDGLQRALTAEEEAAAGKTIIANLSLAFGSGLTPETDLCAAAESYLQAIGMTAEEITALRAALR